MIGNAQFIFLLGMGTFVIAGTALFYEWRRSRDPAAAWWSFAFLACTIAAGTFPLRQFDGLDVVSIGLANAMFLLSYSAICAGIWKYYGRRVNGAVVGAPSVLWLLFWSLCPLASDFDMRVAVGSFLAAVVSLVTARGALFGKARMLGRALVLLMAFRTGFFAVRAIWASTILGPISDAERAIGFEIVLVEGLWSSVISGYLLLALLRENRERLLVKLSETDYLTGADNRRAFQLKAEAAWQNSSDRRETTLLMFDLDNFKHINDAHGHAFGDGVLKDFAAIVSARVCAGDVFARLGGEEFAPLLPGRDAAAGARFAETLRADFAEAMLARTVDKVRVTVSIGIASTRHATSLDRLLGIADEALYRAKANGRNRIECGPCSQKVVAAPAYGTAIAC